MTKTFKDIRPIVVIETPFGGEVCANVAFARACLADSIGRGEAPFASHLLYTQPGVLDDDKPEERKMGIEAGWTFHHAASLVAVYVNRGISNGMREGIEHAKSLGIPVEERTLAGSVWDDHALAFPPGSAEPEDEELVTREEIARDIRVVAVRSSPRMVRVALESVADAVERGQ